MTADIFILGFCFVTICGILILLLFYSRICEKVSIIDNFYMCICIAILLICLVFWIWFAIKVYNPTFPLPNIHKHSFCYLSGHQILIYMGSIYIYSKLEQKAK